MATHVRNQHRQRRVAVASCPISEPSAANHNSAMPEFCIGHRTRGHHPPLSQKPRKGTQGTGKKVGNHLVGREGLSAVLDHALPEQILWDRPSAQAAVYHLGLCDARKLPRESTHKRTQGQMNTSWQRVMSTQHVYTSHVNGSCQHLMSTHIMPAHHVTSYHHLMSAHRDASR